jgi:hypothetical protein
MPGTSRRRRPTPLPCDDPPIVLKDLCFHSKAALGREKRPYDWLSEDKEYNERLHSYPGYVEGAGFSTSVCASATGRRPRSRASTFTRPVQVWAVRIDRNGVHWFDAEIIKITERNVMVRYAGETARLDRLRLFIAWAWWRAVRFVSSRTGRIAAELEEAWHERYGREAGAVPPAMRMPRDEAMALLGVPENYTREDVLAAFRRAVKKAHPDLGGTAEMFHKLVEARDRLLAALGTSAPPPKPPVYAPSGVTLVYRSGGGSCRPSLGMIRQLPGR